MSDIDDAQIKDEIDGIMNGVKTIMEKIDALTPNEEPEQGQGLQGPTGLAGDDEESPWETLDKDEIADGAMSATAALSAPTPDEAFVVVEGDSGIRPMDDDTLESALAGSGQSADATAEIDLADLGLDLDALDDSSADDDEMGGFNHLKVAGQTVLDHLGLPAVVAA